MAFLVSQKRRYYVTYNNRRGLRMIFISLLKEDLVQVNDKTRLDVSKSFISGDSITDIIITPEVGATPVSVFNSDQDKWYLDWSYSTSGTETIGVEATDGTNTVSQSFEIEIISELDDNLYSNDSQIFAIETELKRYFPQGRNSYKNVHREAQSRILNYLDRKRIWNSDGTAITKDQLNITDDIQEWSLYEAIAIIYSDLFISGGDKFSEKLNEYKTLKNYERDRSALRIDKNKNGAIDASTEMQDLKSFRLIKR